MSADKDREVVLKEEFKEELKEAVQEDVKDEVKEDQKEDTKAETGTAPASSDSAIPDVPVASPPLFIPSATTPDPKVEPFKAAAVQEPPSHEAVEAVSQQESSESTPQETAPQETAPQETVQETTPRETSAEVTSTEVAAPNSSLEGTSHKEAIPQEATPRQPSTTASQETPHKDLASEATSLDAAAALTAAAAVTAAAAAEVVAEKAASIPKPAAETAKLVDDLEDVPDPDEDDLDDLDDMLDEFSAVKLDQAKSSQADATSSGPEATKDSGPSGKQAEVEDAFSEEEFAKQLQAGMADLLGELEQSPDMQAQFEDIFKHIAAAEGTGDAPPSSASKGPAPQAAPEDASFQDTIKRTMERMQASGDQATAAAASGSGDDFMSEMLKQLSSGDLGDLGGEGSEEEFSKMLMGMMEQLTNKEILYEPMKELDEKFPEWLIKNRDSTPKEDLKRYEEQQSIVREIVAKFEQKTYSDSNATDREFIVDKMQKMQAAGSPPPDLVGDMQSAQDALNPGDEACNPQ
ncbi:PEX19-like protein [Fusarium heterosporum]|uniref:PEX19-like protein n=1 Tax=Fusarium heterosporum TaxID=42747 RepID=A0A8H5TPS9_FUSHE|nr:PEX19-like protein [Fusarium heterosporum]